MILGAGYSYDTDKFNALTDDKKMLVNKLLRFTDGKSDIIEFLTNVIWDYLVFGQYAFLTSFQEGNTKITGLKWRSISKLRIVPEEDGCEIDKFMYCQN